MLGSKQQILTGKTDLIEASVLNLSRIAEERIIHETAVP